MYRFAVAQQGKRLNSQENKKHHFISVLPIGEIGIQYLKEEKIIMGKNRPRKKKSFDKGKLILWLYAALIFAWGCIGSRFIVLNRLYIELSVDSCIAIITAIIWLCKKNSLSKGYIACIAVFNFFMGWIIFYDYPQFALPLYNLCSNVGLYETAAITNRSNILSPKYLRLNL